MSAFSHARWGRFVGLCGLVLLAEALSRGVDGLLAIAKDEAQLRGRDAVMLLDRKVWSDLRGQRLVGDVAQSVLSRETSAASPRVHGSRRAAGRPTAASTMPHRMRRLHVGAVAGSRPRQRPGRPQQRSARGAQR